jgi:competence protein ComEA
MSLKNNNPASKAGRFFNGWTVAAVLLLAIIITGSAFIGSKYNRGRGIEISLESEDKSVGQIYVGGEVDNPGLYPLQAGDSLDDILKAAGGLSDNADPGQLKLAVAGKGEAGTPQKVDVNRAEAWLLAALPGIGETRAQAIVAYRQKNGPFRDINELLKVPGIGSVTFEGIKNLITVDE